MNKPFSNPNLLDEDDGWIHINVNDEEIDENEDDEIIESAS